MTMTGSRLDGHFTSPLEFVKHAEWLMRRTRSAHRRLDAHRSPRCKCNFCDRDDGGDSQSAISSKLKRVRARILAQIDGDGVQGDEG